MSHFLPRSCRLAALLALGLAPLFPLAVGAAEPTATEAQPVDAEAAYRRTITERAEKIVAPLSLADTAQEARVRDLVAQQYLKLRDIHDARDAQLKALPASAAAAARQAVTDATHARLYALHAAYLAGLSVELTPGQIEQVKDGMTYGVLPLTYRVYQEMLPDLTAEQKRQILAWLTEAREFAMDAGSSHEKHGWFGKYKGRINNYLAKAGIDMKQAEKAMLDRKNAAPAQ